MTKTIDSPILIVGSGLAGLTLALKLARDDFKVSILSKKEVDSGSTPYAQGGIAAALADEDSYESHASDTHIAGAGLCNEETVNYVIERGPQAIQWLIDEGTEFTKQDGDYHLTREGGHSHRRIIHAADATGRAVHETLAEKCINHPNITIYTSHVAVDLITSKKLGLPGTNRCLGLYALDKERKRVVTFRAGRVVIATGGYSKVYLFTSNSDTTTGDGIAMAWRAGCSVGNMEFNQFHPTCLFHPHAKSFLISEAVRGEGGKLVLSDGSSFMQRHDERGELAPRDIVARAIDYEIKKSGEESVFLDISHRDPEFVKSHFPTIYAKCLQFGLDMTKEPLPVVPAAHFTCGGIYTDLKGRTDLAHLYAAGECTFTGLHGANRLASNSLLECVVFGHAVYQDIVKNHETIELPATPLPQWDESQVTDPDEQVVVSHNWDELRRFMWDYVGIVRTSKRLERAMNRIHLLQVEIQEYYGNFKINNDLIELRNLVQVAELIVESAMQREESRGLHYTLDYPDSEPDELKKDTILRP
ncbi:MAG: L-aspartate oxidase [Saprospiraceae bacterium]|jgi:L-aspartate oxidase